MPVQQFSLRDTYGAGVQDRQVEQLRGQRIESGNRQSAAADVFRSTAQQAVKDGTYSPAVHARALETAGYPEAAQGLRQQSLARLEQGYEYLQHALPFANAQTWPSIKRKAEEGGLVPPGALPEQFDPEFVSQLEQRMVGQLTELYGDLEQVATGPGGAAIFGQRDQNTGKLANVTTVRPPAPKADSAPRPPSGYRFAGDGESLEAIPGGPADEPQASGLKSADSNAIYRQTAAMFGGMRDPMTGHVHIDDPATAKRAQQVAARASQIYAQGQGRVDHASAVQAAFEEVQAIMPAPAEEPEGPGFFGRFFGFGEQSAPTGQPQPGGQPVQIQTAAAAADVFRSTAQQAVKDGTYSPAVHARALETAGYPEAAQGARASEIFAQGNVPHAVAVEQAFQELTGQPAPVPPTATDGPVQIQTAADYAQLPSGAQYLDPSGQLRTKR